LCRGGLWKESIFCTIIFTASYYSFWYLQTFLKQWWPIFPPVSTKRTTISHIRPFNIKKTTTYSLRNKGPCLVHTQTCDGVNPVNGIPTLPLVIMGSPNGRTDITKQIKKTCKDSFPFKMNILKINDNTNIDSTITSYRRWMFVADWLLAKKVGPIITSGA